MSEDEGKQKSNKKIDNDFKQNKKQELYTKR